MYFCNALLSYLSAASSLMSKIFYDISYLCFNKLVLAVLIVKLGVGVLGIETVIFDALLLLELLFFILS